MTSTRKEPDDALPDGMSGLRELVRLLAKQAAREAVASAGTAPSSIDSETGHPLKE